jgi:hypothetical protein
MIGAARDYDAEHADSSIELVVIILFTSGDHEIFKRVAGQG